MTPAGGGCSQVSFGGTCPGCFTLRCLADGPEALSTWLTACSIRDLMSRAALALRYTSVLTSLATTAKPRPSSPVRAASAYSGQVSTSCCFNQLILFSRMSDFDSQNEKDSQTQRKHGEYSTCSARLAAETCGIKAPGDIPIALMMLKRSRLTAAASVSMSAAGVLRIFLLLSRGNIATFTVMNETHNTRQRYR